MYFTSSIKFLATNAKAISKPFYSRVCMSLEFRCSLEISYNIKTNVITNNSSRYGWTKVFAKTDKVLNDLVTGNNGICCVLTIKPMATLHGS